MGIKESASGAQIPRTEHQARYWGVSRLFSPPSTPQQRQSRPLGTRRFQVPPRQSQSASRAPRRAGGHQVQVPASTERRRVHSGEKKAKTKLSPPTRKANHTPCIPQPRWGPAPTILRPGPRGSQSAPLRGLSRDTGASGSEWGCARRARAPTALSPPQPFFGAPSPALRSRDGRAAPKLR